MSEFILSCTTCALRAPHKDEVSETFKYAPAAGYKYWGAAGPSWTPYVGRWLDAERIKAEAAKAGLAGCTEVYSPTVNTRSVEEAIKSVESIVVHAEYAVQMESPLLVITGGRRSEGTDGLAASAARLKELMSRIGDLPIRVALEPHYNSWFRDVDDYVYIFDRIDHPQLGITVDTGHFHRAQVDTVAFVRKFAPKIWNVHVKDHRGPKSVAIGAGEVDLESIIAVLHEVGYQGALALEIEVEDKENLPRYVAESYPLLSSMVEKITGVKPE